MNKATKMVVVVALLVVVGLVVAMKAREDAPVANQVAAARTRGSVGPTPELELPRFVDLGADKCIPCKMMVPILEELKSEYAGTVQVEFIDVWKDPEAGRRYSIKLIPTQIFFDATGKERWRHEGFISKEDILTKWNELGVDVAGQVALRPE